MKGPDTGGVLRKLVEVLSMASMVFQGTTITERVVEDGSLSLNAKVKRQPGVTAFVWLEAGIKAGFNACLSNEVTSQSEGR